MFLTKAQFGSEAERSGVFAGTTQPCLSRFSQLRNS